MAWGIAMKSVNDGFPNRLFGGVFAVIADALGQSYRFLPSASGAALTAAPATRPASPSGWAARIGRWWERRQAERVAPELARAQDVFDRLDNWMWRQHTREVESYLAKSSDVFDLERRIESLDRSPGIWIP